MKDIKLKDNDIEMSGDIQVIDASTEQNANLILQSNAGEWKDHAIIGYDLTKYIYDDKQFSEFELLQIKQALALDNIKADVSYTREGFKISIEKP